MKVLVRIQIGFSEAGSLAGVRREAAPRFDLFEPPPLTERRISAGGGNRSGGNGGTIARA